jgi:hypothetical protein
VAAVIIGLALYAVAVDSTSIDATVSEQTPSRLRHRFIRELWTWAWVVLAWTGNQHAVVPEVPTMWWQIIVVALALCAAESEGDLKSPPHWAPRWSLVAIAVFGHDREIIIAHDIIISRGVMVLPAPLLPVLTGLSIVSFVLVVSALLLGDWVWRFRLLNQASLRWLSRHEDDEAWWYVQVERRHRRHSLAAYRRATRLCRFLMRHARLAFGRPPKLTSRPRRPDRTEAYLRYRLSEHHEETAGAAEACRIAEFQALGPSPRPSNVWDRLADALEQERRDLQRLSDYLVCPNKPCPIGSLMTAESAVADLSTLHAYTGYSALSRLRPVEATRLEGGGALGSMEGVLAALQALRAAGTETLRRTGNLWYGAFSVLAPVYPDRPVTDSDRKEAREGVLTWIAGEVTPDAQQVDFVVHWLLFAYRCARDWDGLLEAARRICIVRPSQPPAVHVDMAEAYAHRALLLQSSHASSLRHWALQRACDHMYQGRSSTFLEELARLTACITEKPAA